MIRPVLFLTVSLLFCLTAGAEPAPDSPRDEPAGEADSAGSESEEGFSETISVTSSRTSIPLDQSGSSVTVIDRDEIELRQSMQVGDLLRGVPGVAVSRSGSTGSLTQIRIRGAEANQVLLLVDGVAVNDVFAGDEVPLELLTTYDTERIEVVRGPQSGLWGADALAGVVNIITRDPAGQTGGALQLESGSFGTVRGAGSLDAGSGSSHLAVHGSYLDTDGTNIARQGGEEDGYRNATASLRYGWIPEGRPYRLEILGRHTDAESDSDGIDFLLTGLPADAERSSETELSVLSATGKWDQARSRWSHKVQAAAVRSDTSSFDTGAFTDSTAMNKIDLSWQSTVKLGPAASSLDQNLTVALNHENREFRQRGTATPFGDPNQDQEIDSTGAVLEYRLGRPESWFMSTSVRHDRNSDFESETTYRASGSYAMLRGRTRLRAGFGTGQKPPTFIERFGFFSDTFVGNPDLVPESSTGWELGIDQQITRKGRVELAYFRDRLTDEINGFVFDSGLGLFTAGNESGTSHRQGVELGFRAALPRGVQLGGSYTFTDATEPSGGGVDQEELRRPRHTAQLSLRYGPKRIPAEFMLNVSHVGSQVDLFFPPFPQPSERLRLDAYQLVDLTARYRIDRHLELFGRVENVLDEEYEDVYGFQAQGIGAYVGVRYLSGSAVHVADGG